MILLPAIDIRHGRAVRLRQGDFDQETVYADDPLAAARAWVEAGARWLHVVDLDGARTGRPRAIEHLGRIASEGAVPVQYGGGLRSPEAVGSALAAGATRVVIGTAALRDEDLLDTLLARHGERVAVAVDARRGEAAVAGWTEGSGEPVEVVVGRLRDRGATRIVYTDVERDGMLGGPDLDGLRRVARTAGAGAEVVYSGGIGSLDDLRALAGADVRGLTGVVSGKALYEGRFTVAQGQAMLDAATVGS